MTLIGSHIDRIIAYDREFSDLETTLRNNWEPLKSFKSLHLKLEEFKNRGTYLHRTETSAGWRA